MKSLCSASIVLCLFCASIQAAETWSVERAVTSVQFNDHIVTDLGLTIKTQQTSAEPYRSDYLGFTALPGPTVTFEAPGGDYEHMDEGVLKHQGGWVFGFGDKEYSLMGFQLQVTHNPPDNFILAGANGTPYFVLQHAHSYLRPELRELLLLNIDMALAPEFATQLGRPDLADIYIGTVDMALTIDVPDSVGSNLGTCLANFNGIVDIELTSMGTVSQYAREAGVRVALSVSSSLANVGTADVPWYRSIAPDGGVSASLIGQHPYLVLHFYRVNEGVLEQIGVADVKHAFYSINSGCPCSGGQVIYVGCGDTYGAGTNASRFYLAPREEVTASTGDWSSLSSHFDGTPVDDFRHHGSSGHDSFDHRMVVPEKDLETAGAEYLVESWYVVKNDVNIYNNMGHDLTVPNLVGNTWSFSRPEPNHRPGPAIDSWVAPETIDPHERSTLIDMGEDGQLKLAVKVTRLGYRHWQYEYALMNFDFDRQVGSFSIPMPEEATVLSTGAGPLGATRGTSAIWTSQVTADGISWAAPVGEGLDWGRLYNFRFETTRRPGGGDSTFGVIEPGSPDSIGVATLAPTPDCNPLSGLQAQLPCWQNTCTILDYIRAVGNLCY